MKTTIWIISIIFCLAFIAGCGKNDLPPDLSERAAESSSQDDDATTYTGQIESLGVDIYKDGTHQLVTDDNETIVIQSSIIDLNDYIGKKVKVEGSMQKLIDNISEVFTVTKVELLDAGAGGETTDYKSTMFGFKFSYPDVWSLSEESTGLALTSGGTEWVSIDIFHNVDTDLDEFVAAKEIEDGAAVTIGSQRSLRYIDEDGIRIYTPNASKKKIYLMTFYDKGSDSETHKKLFYAFLETFEPIINKVVEGDVCGGKENIACAENYRCELESSDEDAEGVCVSVESGETGADCPFVSVPAGCKDYKVKSVNKNNCPTSYECLDEPVAQTETGTETTSSTIGSTIGSTTGSTIGTSFLNNYAKILPADATLYQLEIVKEQSLLAASYTLESVKYRALYEFSASSAGYDFTEKAAFKEGEERDWELVSGKDIMFEYDKEVIKVGSAAAPVVVLSGMRLYENTHKDFSLQYPSGWYYRSFGQLDNTIWSVGFAAKPLDHISDAAVSVVILNGAGTGKKETSGDRYTVEADRDSDTHFLIDGPLSMKDTVDKMAGTILQN